MKVCFGSLRALFVWASNQLLGCGRRKPKQIASFSDGLSDLEKLRKFQNRKEARKAQNQGFWWLPCEIMVCATAK
jgi:hypothetical protein